MKQNVGTFDRWIRIVLGVVMIVWGFTAGSWWGAIGLIPLITGIIGYCGLYSIFGISTCKK